MTQEDPRKTLAYQLGRLEGFDDGWQKAAAQYMLLIRKVLKLQPLQEQPNKQEEDNGK